MMVADFLFNSQTSALKIYQMYALEKPYLLVSYDFDFIQGNMVKDKGNFNYHAILEATTAVEPYEPV